MPSRCGSGDRLLVSPAWRLMTPGGLWSLVAPRTAGGRFDNGGALVGGRRPLWAATVHRRRRETSARPPTLRPIRLRRRSAIWWPAPTEVAISAGRYAGTIGGTTRRRRCRRGGGTTRWGPGGLLRRRSGGLLGRGPLAPGRGFGALGGGFGALGRGAGMLWRWAEPLWRRSLALRGHSGTLGRRARVLRSHSGMLRRRARAPIGLPARLWPVIPLRLGGRLGPGRVRRTSTLWWTARGRCLPWSPTLRATSVATPRDRAVPTVRGATALPRRPRAAGIARRIIASITVPRW